jgi:uncharacterized protein
MLNAIAGGGSFLDLCRDGICRHSLDRGERRQRSHCFPVRPSAWTYRRDLPQIEGISTGNLIAASFAGSAIGSGLLIVTPQRRFDAIVPWLLLAATLLLAFGPTVTPFLRRFLRLGPATLIAVQFVIAI